MAAETLTIYGIPFIWFWTTILVVLILILVELGTGLISEYFERVRPYQIRPRRGMHWYLRCPFGRYEIQYFAEPNGVGICKFKKWRYAIPGYKLLGKNSTVVAESGAYLGLGDFVSNVLPTGFTADFVDGSFSGNMDEMFKYLNEQNIRKRITVKEAKADDADEEDSYKSEEYIIGNRLDKEYSEMLINERLEKAKAAKKKVKEGKEEPK